MRILGVKWNKTSENMNFYFNKCITNIHEEHILLLMIYTENEASADYAEKGRSEIRRKTTYV